MFPSAKFVRHLYAWHKWTGILGGAFILFLLLSGTVAVFREEIDWLVTPALRVEPRPCAAKRPLEEMLGAVGRAFPPAEVNSIQITADATTAYVFSLTEKGGAARAVFVDPYTSEVTGTRRGETLANVIRQAHVRFYYFGANGRIVVGVFGLLLLVSSVTGLCIYAPFMKTVFKQGRRFWQLRDGARPATSDFHKLVGILTLIFNLILGLTGAVLGLENLTRYHQPTDALIHPRPDRRLKPRDLANRLSVDAAADVARRSLPGFEPNQVTLPKAGVNHFVFAGDLRGRFERANASFVVVDTQSGAVLQTHDAARVRTVTKFYNLSEPLHFGDFAGLPLKILYFLFGAAGTALSATGFVILYFRKRRVSGVDRAGRCRRRAAEIEARPHAATVEAD